MKREKETVNKGGTTAEKISTRQRIMDEALTLFSEKGYGAVSVGQIADAVGIKAPSLYKHYESKQDIFDAILAEMDRRYRQQAAGMKLDGGNAAVDARIYENISTEQLVHMGKELFLYFLHDEYTAKFRRMLTVEQFHNSDLAALYTKQYVDDVLKYQSALLGMLVQAGILQGNPQVMALQFYAPIYLLLTMCDRQPEREAEALVQLEQHIVQFGQCHAGAAANVGTDQTISYTQEGEQS